MIVLQRTRGFRDFQPSTSVPKIMASFVVDWTVPTTCTSATRLSKRVTILEGVRPLMNAALNVVFEEAQPGMTVILQDKTEKWSGIIESKWGELRDL